MSESHLSQKISLCQYIETLNDDGCLQVIRLLQHYQKYKHLNQFLIKVLMQTTDQMDVESLQQMHNEIKQMSCNNKYVQMRQSPCVKSKNSEKSPTIDHDNIIFPLFRLPIDMIQNASLFLNENDIFHFEKCCRSFYKMINNSTYLKQTKNFKTLRLYNKRLNQMIEPKYSFYKYSQASTMGVNVLVPAEKTVTTFINETQSKWDQIKCIEKYHGYWLTNLLKSIKSLTLSADPTMALLPKLPLNILFDPQSRLNWFSINHHCNSEGKCGRHLQRAIDEFEKQYLELKEQYQQEGKKIKKLKWLEYSSYDADDKVTGPLYIEAKHLILLNVRKDFAAPHAFSTVNVLTCNAFEGLSVVDTLGKIDCNIDTFRLIGCSGYDSTDICVNDKLIQALNLHSTLVNLTIEVDIRIFAISPYHITRWMKGIETVLLKQYYHNLQNVNILMKIFQSNMDCFFEMLKKHVSILKHQFKQLNIGLEVHGTYCTFEWNPQIDEKYLEKQKHCQERNQGNKRKYKQWLKQWRN